LTISVMVAMSPSRSGRSSTFTAGDRSEQLRPQD
jgi:hypothetical protein